MHRIATLCCLTIFTGGCAMFDSRPAEIIVEERAAERLGRLLEGDFEAAYALTTPGYRTLESVGQYRGRWRGAAMWTGYEVVSVTCNEAGSEAAGRCETTVAISFDAPRMPEVTTHMFETWLLVEGQWYFYQPRGSSL